MCFRRGPLRTLHRNMLLPFNPIHNTDCTVQDPIVKNPPKQTHSGKKKVPALASGISKSDSNSLSSFSPYVEIIKPKSNKRTAVITLSDSTNSASKIHIENTSTVLTNSPLTSLGSTLFWDNVSQSENNTSNYSSKQLSYHTNQSVISENISMVGNSSLSGDEHIDNIINTSSVSNVSAPVQEVRRTTRQRKAPDRLGQWLMSQIQSRVNPNEIFV